MLVNLLYSAKPILICCFQLTLVARAINVRHGLLILTMVSSDSLQGNLFVAETLLFLVNCIIFLAPISAFDQVLAEDPSINRLEDSLAMWRDLCKNKILRGASIVLFLNKCDLLRAKLEAGVKLNQFLVSYGDRPNDYENVTKSRFDWLIHCVWNLCLGWSFPAIKAKFDRIRYDSSRDAQVFTHFITATVINFF